MGDLGSGSGSSYPTALDTQSTPEVNSPNAGKTKARAEVPNDLAGAVIAVETELGIDPAGTLTDVKTFLQTEHGVDGTHDNTKVAMLAGTQDITGDKTLSGTTTMGALAGNGWPSFSVHRNGSAQVITTGTSTKVQWTTEEFDTNSDFASNRFTPTVAGKYLLSAFITFIGIDAYTTHLRIYKNGAEYKSQQVAKAAAAVDGLGVTIVADADGSTDYFEIFVEHNEGSDQSISGTSSISYWSGSRIA